MPAQTTPVRAAARRKRLTRGSAPSRAALSRRRQPRRCRSRTWGLPRAASQVWRLHQIEPGSRGGEHTSVDYHTWKPVLAIRVAQPHRHPPTVQRSAASLEALADREGKRRRVHSHDAALHPEIGPRRDEPCVHNTIGKFTCVPPNIPATFSAAYADRRRWPGLRSARTEARGRRRS